MPRIERHANKKDAFRRVIEVADEGCPFSSLIKASAKVSIDSEVEG